MGQHQQALTVENDGHFEGRRCMLPYEPILGDFVEIVSEGGRARKERGMSVSGSGMRKERGRQGGGPRTPARLTSAITPMHPTMAAALA